MPTSRCLLHIFTSINSAVDLCMLTRQNDVLETLTGYCCVATVVDGDPPSSFHGVRGRLTCKGGCLPLAGGGRVPGLPASRCLMDARRAASVQASRSRTNENRVRVCVVLAGCIPSHRSHIHTSYPLTAPLLARIKTTTIRMRNDFLVLTFFLSISFDDEETP